MLPFIQPVLTSSSSMDENYPSFSSIPTILNFFLYNSVSDDFQRRIDFKFRWLECLICGSSLIFLACQDFHLVA